MTINRSDTIKIPTWLLLIATPIIIALITTLTINRFSAGRDSQQIEVNTDALKNKVDRAEFQIVREQLNRIEAKLDDHIAK